jgi:hypothetical protein
MNPQQAQGQGFGAFSRNLSVNRVKAVRGRVGSGQCNEGEKQKNIMMYNIMI